MPQLGPRWALRVLQTTQVLLIALGALFVLTIFGIMIGVPMVTLGLVTLLGVREARARSAWRLPTWVTGCLVIESVGLAFVIAVLATISDVAAGRNPWSFGFAALVWVAHAVALVAVVRSGSGHPPPPAGPPRGF